MARVNTDILGVSELRWTGMGEFNSDNHYIYYLWAGICPQNELCSFPRQTILYHGNPSLCPNQQCWRSWSWTVLWRPTRPSTTNIQKRCPYHYRGLECKSRKSRNTWSNRQIWPWSTKWSRVKTNRVLLREYTGHSKHLLTKTQEKTLHMDITRWPIPKSDWLYYLQPKMEKLYRVSKNKIGSWLWLRTWTPHCHIHSFFIH